MMNAQTAVPPRSWLLRAGVVSIYAIGCLVIMALAAEGGAGDWLFIAAVYLWALSPVVALASARNLGWLTAVGAAICAAIGLFIYQQALLGPDRDGQAGLALLFVPAYQWLGAGTLMLAAWAWKRLSIRTDRAQ